MSLSKRQETVGQESLAYCTPRGCKESDMAENLNNRQQHKEYTAKYGMKRKRKLVAQSCLTLCDPMNYSPSGTSVHGILQARILEWVAIPFSKGSSQPRDQTPVSCMAETFFTSWATRNFKCLFKEKINKDATLQNSNELRQWFFSERPHIPTINTKDL